jgi:hypothetical protein
MEAIHFSETERLSTGYMALYPEDSTLHNYWHENLVSYNIPVHARYEWFWTKDAEVGIEVFVCIKLFSHLILDLDTENMNCISNLKVIECI